MSKNKDMHQMFMNCYVLNSIDLSSWNTASVTNMANMFYQCQALPYVDVSHFDTAKVTDMSGMFGMCLMLGSDPSLGSLDVSSFKTSNVTSMNGMFSYCTWLTSLDLSNFRTLLVEDMNGMFTFCTMLADPDVSQFDTSNVEDMRNMFDGCQSLKSLDLSKFNTAKITANATVNTMSAMFSNCEALRRVVLGPHFEFKGDSPSVRAESALPGLPEDQDHFVDGKLLVLVQRIYPSVMISQAFTSLKYTMGPRCPISISGSLRLTPFILMPTVAPAQCQTLKCAFATQEPSRPTRL